jgi:signal transduction histidine kinase
MVAMAAAVAWDGARSAGAGRWWPLDVVVDLAICAVALLRARSRVSAAAVGIGIFGLATLIPALVGANTGPVQAGRWVALAVLAASAARWLPPPRAVVIAAVGAAVVAVGQSSHGTGSFKPSALDALSAATLWAGALAVGVWLRYLDRRRESTIDAVRRDERLELARELHDLVAHHVTGIVVQAQAARFAGPSPEPLSAALASIEAAGTDTLTAIRRLVGLLRDPEDTTGVSSVPEPIDQLVERFGRHGPVVDLKLPAERANPAWPPEVASTVYRVVQESLTNVARHAPGARSVTVTVCDQGQQVTVEVADDAPTAAPRGARAPSGYGLVGMRERVEALGGELHAGPLTTAGWAVQASLPVPARTAS